MERITRDILASLSLILIVISIAMPSILFFEYSDIINPEDSFATATVSLTVASPTSPDESGGGSGGGGGGGAAGPSYKTHILDFTLNKEYLIYAAKKDKIKVIFEGGFEYDFDVTKFINGTEMILGFANTSYAINFGEIAYFDLDSDGANDMSVYLLEEGGAKFSILYLPISEEEVLPRMSKEKISYPSLPVPGGRKLSLLFIFILLSVAILIVLVYHQLRLRRIEKTHKERLNKIYSDYKRKKNTQEDRRNTREKLNKQLNLLTKAYRSGYVSRESYLKGKKRIRDILKKI
jgi:hypothetical protein